jgi:hypothetical protein
MAAAQRAGDQSKARMLASGLLKQASNADTPRASLEQAKALAGG